MPEIKRKLASIQRIISVTDHPNADRLDICRILGWNVIVKKGSFNVNDLCVFFEVDSIIPKKLWSEFLVDKNRPDKPIRLKTVRLRKIVSQGLAIPIDELGMDAPISVAGGFLKEGEDVTEALEVKLYEPIIAANLAGKVRGNFPSFLKKTDTHRVQAHPKTIEELKACGEIYITIKYDGTSSTFYNKIEEAMDRKGNVVDYFRFGVCSRNMDLIETEENTYWKMAKKYDLLYNTLKEEIAIQGECYGQGIQKNRLGIDDVSLGVFDVFDIRKYIYYDLDKLIEFCHSYDLTMVQVIYRGPMKWDTVDELVEFANEQRYPNGSQAEGIVIRPVIEAYSEALQGRLAVKVISPKYLLKD